MNKIDREIITEDLEFIRSYVLDLLIKHPGIAVKDMATIEKIDRRLDDISRRMGA